MNKFKVGKIYFDPNENGVAPYREGILISKRNENTLEAIKHGKRSNYAIETWFDGKTGIPTEAIREKETGNLVFCSYTE